MSLTSLPPLTTDHTTPLTTAPAGATTWLWLRQHRVVWLLLLCLLTAGPVLVCSCLVCSVTQWTADFLSAAAPAQLSTAGVRAGVRGALRDSVWAVSDWGSGWSLGGHTTLTLNPNISTFQVRLQTQSASNPLYRGTWDCLGQTVRREGLRALYKGKSIILSTSQQHHQNSLGCFSSFMSEISRAESKIITSNTLQLRSLKSRLSDPSAQESKTREKKRLWFFPIVSSKVKRFDAFFSFL